MQYMKCHFCQSIGKRTALRLVLHLLQQDPKQTERLAFALQNLAVARLNIVKSVIIFLM